MKTLIFSDTHLYQEVETKKLIFLQKLISNVDQVIIAGDFWEGLIISFDDFINSGWRQLFPLLKQKKTIYLYGNHDPKSQCDQRVKLFSTMQKRQYKFSQNGQRFVVEHGDRFHFGRYNLFFRSKFNKKLLSRPFFIKWAHYRLLEHLTRTYGPSIWQKPALRLNKQIKRCLAKDFSSGEILICGHTHAAEVDLKHRFVNTGIIRHGLAQYIIVEDGQVYLKEEWYDKPKKMANLS